ncbi:hypothetical protein ABT297_04610 [Dactylosporangium sp. NPDC000555]|uniref:hypothetical protein n=1 Tax=Dactylosporangium sp. NPDC000555 TaxID=3154260 RepID=UPI003316D01F
MIDGTVLSVPGALAVRARYPKQRGNHGGAGRHRNTIFVPWLEHGFRRAKV